MMKLMPDIQVGPLAGVLMWVVVALIIIGFLFASTGGALVWALFWIVVAVIAYFTIGSGLRRVFG